MRLNRSTVAQYNQAVVDELVPRGGAQTECRRRSKVLGDNRMQRLGVEGTAAMNVSIANHSGTRPTLLIVYIGLAALLAACGDGGSSSSSSRDVALTNAIRAGMEQASIPGVIVGIWQDGKAPYVRAFGVRDTVTKEPMTTDLYVRVGSITKTFAITALLQLVDQGKAQLDDPIANYVDGVPNGDLITLRQLAGMRSGLRSYTKSVIPMLEDDPDHQWTLPELYAFSYPYSPCFAPDERFDYSNTNTVLIGEAIENILCRSPLTCQGLESYIEEHVAKPAGLRHTVFPTDATIPLPHAHGYAKLRNGAIADTTDWNPSWGWAAGGMISTLDDMRVWTRVLADGSLISPDLQRQRLEFRPAPQEGEGALYGLGMENDNGWIGHNGNIVGYLSFAFYLPAEQITMVVLFN